MPALNIRIEYQYRDAGNYKNWDSFVFANPSNLPISEIEKFITDSLIDGEFFYTEDWGLPDLHFVEYPWDNDIDHDWHQFLKIEFTDEYATASINEFLARSHPRRAEWNRITTNK